MSSLIVEVVRIDDLIAHPNADKLEIVVVKGWNCIVQKETYSKGDLVVFIPPDSVLTDTMIVKYNLEFLKNGGRVGSIKLRGVMSQGLVLGLDCLTFSNYKEGDSVANELGIKKWFPPERTAGGQPNPLAAINPNPDFRKYTEIENIKNFNSVFEDGDDIVVLEKIHGANARFGIVGISYNPDDTIIQKLKYLFKKYILGETQEFVYGSHNLQLKIDSKIKDVYGESMWAKVAIKYNIKESLKNLQLEDIIIYGEVYGKGVQDLTYGLEDVDLVIFDVKYKGKYVDWEKACGIAYWLGISTVPTLYVGKYNDSILSTHTDGNSILCPTQIREGCVIKSAKESNHTIIGRKILKSVSADYLTRKGGTEYQ